MTDWLFQANPKRYDLLAATDRGVEDDWSMNQNRDLVAVGDRVFFLVSGAQAGIYVTGRVVSPVYKKEQEDEFGRWKVDVEYLARVDPPALRAELLEGSDRVLAAYQPFRGLQGTNYVMPVDVAEKLVELIRPRLKPLLRKNGRGFDETAHAVDVALKRHDAHLRQQTLEFLKTLSPENFEGVIRLLLERLGYEDALVTGRSGDGGIDVVATLRLHGVVVVPTVIQAKRWRDRNVSGGVVRELRGALKVGQHGVLITTSDFTKDARVEAAAPGKASIGLIDGMRFVDLLFEHGVGVESRLVPLRKLDTSVLLQLSPEASEHPPG